MIARLCVLVLCQTLAVDPPSASPPPPQSGGSVEPASVPPKVEVPADVQFAMLAFAIEFDAQAQPLLDEHDRLKEQLSLVPKSIVSKQRAPDGWAINTNARGDRILYFHSSNDRKAYPHQWELRLVAVDSALDGLCKGEIAPPKVHPNTMTKGCFGHLDMAGWEATIVQHPADNATLVRFNSVLGLDGVLVCFEGRSAMDIPDEKQVSFKGMPIYVTGTVQYESVLGAKRTVLRLVPWDDIANHPTFKDRRQQLGKELRDFIDSKGRAAPKPTH